MSDVRLLLLVDLAAQQLSDNLHQIALLVGRVLCCAHASSEGGSFEWSYKLINSGISPGAWQGVLLNAAKAAGKYYGSVADRPVRGRADLLSLLQHYYRCKKAANAGISAHDVQMYQV